jgi:predicted AAA+ superfamily ATPase
LAKRLAEPAPGRIQLLAGPRQVGKTTLLLEIFEQDPKQSIYAAADAPEAALPGFWERIVGRAENTAVAYGRAILLLDEAHLLHDWASHLKGVWDRFRRKKTPVHIVATGSSALHLAAGSRESLAGRFERLTLSHWSAQSVARTFGVKGDEAADLVVRMGSYPGAFPLRKDAPRWSAYVRDAILDPAIGRDILALASVRRPALLRQVFGVAASSPAQIVSLQKLQGQLQDSGALETVAHYLALLEEAFLVAALTKYSTRAARRRAAPPKLVTLNNALLAVMDPQGIASSSGDPGRFGAWVELRPGRLVLARRAARSRWCPGRQLGQVGNRGEDGQVPVEGSHRPAGVHTPPSCLQTASRLQRKRPHNGRACGDSGDHVARVPAEWPAR